MDVMMCECYSCERFTAATFTHYLSPVLLLKCAKKISCKWRTKQLVGLYSVSMETVSIVSIMIQA